MVSYANMKLKLNNQTKELNWNGNKIEIKEYLPFEDKYDLIMITLQKSFEDGIYNPLKLDMYFHLYLVLMYTNINFTEKQKEDEFKLYNILKSNGLIDFIVAGINEDEYNELYEYLLETEEKISINKRSIVSLIENVISDLPQQAEAMKEILDTFDKDKYQEVINFAKAANGGREIH